MLDLGSGFQQCRWCSQHERRTLKYPHRYLYIHATAHIWCFGQLTRYHKARDLVDGYLWFPPEFQIVLRGETITLEARSVIDRIEQESHKDPDLMDRFPDHLHGTFFVFWSMMDTAALVHDEWNVRPLRDPEHEALSRVISPFVIIQPNSTQMGLRDAAAHQ